ncbi:MAG: glycosyltransferase family 1 protein [Epsilonproteobacteria bacterium]|nr:glycosyltransferase family 1 protein [Campylobacterota bacterium]
MQANTLLLTRLSHGNIHSRPDTYTIWDAYKYGLEENLANFTALDYYDLYFEHGKDGFEQELEKTIIKHSIEYLFIGFAAEDFTIDLQFLLHLKHKYNLCIINTSQDPETFFEARDRYYNQIADYILPFTVLKNNFLYANYNLNSITLYSLYNKEMFPHKSLPKTIDVSFIGNINKASRREYISYLQEHGINVQTYGAGSENGFIDHNQMIDVINSSKINLNFTDSALSTSFDFNTNTNFTIGTHINSKIQQAKGRLIEIYMTKSFCLSQDGPGTRVLFNDERILFHSKEDLLEKIRYYLQHEDKHRQITEELHKHALKFDAKNRFQEILPQLHYRSKKIEKLWIDKDFITNYTSYHFLYFFNFLFKRKFKLVVKSVKYLRNTKALIIAPYITILRCKPSMPISDTKG